MKQYRELIKKANNNGVSVIEGTLCCNDHSAYIICEGKKIILLQNQDNFSDMSSELSRVLEKIM